MAAHTVPVHSRSGRARSLASSTVLDGAAYWCAMGAIYIAYGFLWYYSAKEKLFDQNGTMPAGLAKGFHGSLLDSFPGLNAAWLLLGILEAVAFVTFVVSLAAGEFLPSRSKPILLGGLAVSMLTFAVMTFAQNMISGFDSVASLFGYMTGTAVVFLLVRILPPHSPRNWVTGSGTSE